MKKLLSFVLVAVMICTMSVTAFAAETNNGTNPTTITVNGTYQGSTEGGTVISVGVAWDAMEFTYTQPSEGTWNPSTHSYENGVTGGWSTNTATITVTNHSNTSITATCTFTAGEKATGVVGKFDGETTKTLTVESANDPEYQTAVDGVYPAPSASTEFGISGAAITENVTLGVVTVTIAKAQPI